MAFGFLNQEQLNINFGYLAIPPPENHAFLHAYDISDHENPLFKYEKEWNLNKPSYIHLTSYAHNC